MGPPGPEAAASAGGPRPSADRGADAPATTVAEVDLGALRHNARVLRTQAGDAGVLGVVKADAYGHGAVAVSRALVEVGVARLAVATVGEGVALREAGLRVPILVFAAPLPDALPAYAAHDLSVTVSSPEVARALAASGVRVPAHVEVETGMHRLGVAPADVPEVLARLRAAGVPVQALWTHLATADQEDPSFAAVQGRRFLDVLAALGGEVPPMVHVENGPALVRGADVLPEALRQRLAGRRWVRPGGVLYGLASGPTVRQRMDALGLRPVMRLVSRVVHLQTVPPGESVSYGRGWTAARSTRVATVPAGYADGLPRALTGCGVATVGGREVPYAGRVCMDMTMLDLGPPDGPGAEVRVGDAVVLLGPGGPSAERLAALAGTMSYEITCGLTARVPRRPTPDSASLRPEPPVRENPTGGGVYIRSLL